MTKTTDEIGFVFIHGAGLTPSIWSGVIAGLDNPCLLLEHPPERRGLTLNDYVAHMKLQVDAWDIERVVLVAHSLGGVLALKLAEALGSRVVGFAAVGAVIPSRGGSFLSTLPLAKRLLMGALLRLIGTKPPEPAIRQGLCHDLTQAQTDDVVRAFVPESIRVYTDRTDAPLPAVPKLYVQLSQDREMNTGQQAQMRDALDARFTEVLDSGHLPMLSRPDELRGVLDKFMASVEGHVV
ncbi:alpha/beta fold hydrolase [Paenibacillus sp. HJGM_3]|uniref:alpha/beta fold hydrolase n=1 Tax=Paenibacillus sp. HJGM_3 TaxID=3379816 RepID=UPI00385EE0E5